MCMVQHTDIHMGTHVHVCMGEARVSCDICIGWPIRDSPYEYGLPVYVWVAHMYMEQPIRVWVEYLYGTEHTHC